MLQFQCISLFYYLNPQFSLNFPNIQAKNKQTNKLTKQTRILLSVQKQTQNWKKNNTKNKTKQKKKLLEIRIWLKKTIKIKHNCDLKTNGIDILTLLRACLVMYDSKDLSIKKI